MQGIARGEQIPQSDQKTMLSSEAWFAGLIDGEGCFTLSISKQHRRSLQIAPRFSISMKEGLWEKEVRTILETHHIPFHVRKRLNQTELVVSSGVAVRRMISFLLPGLVVKRPLAAKLMAFPRAPPRNRFAPIDPDYVTTVCNLVDYVRSFNKGKNRKRKWDGRAVRDYLLG